MRVVAVTGAAGGIGSALCELFLSMGKEVYALDMDGNSLASLADRLSNKRLHIFELNVADKARFENVCQEIVAEQGSLDCLVNNAGIMSSAAFEDVDDQLWDRIIAVNLLGVVNGCRAALSVMRPGGCIVNVSSTAGITPVLYSAPYVATKHAVVGLTNTLREEMKSRGINVQLVIPGMVDTAIFDRSIDRGGLSSRQMADQAPVAKYSPRDAAQQIVDGIESGKPVIVFPMINKLLLFVYRMAPGLVSSLIARNQHHG